MQRNYLHQTPLFSHTFCHTIHHSDQDDDDEDNFHDDDEDGGKMGISGQDGRPRTMTMRVDTMMWSYLYELVGWLAIPVQPGCKIIIGGVAMGSILMKMRKI